MATPSSNCSLLMACLLLPGCFAGSRELVQRPLEPIGDDDAQIALISVRGEILPYADDGTSLGKNADAVEIVLRLRAAGRDKHVKAVVLDLDTGGGDATASDLIYRAVMEVRNHDHKPVVAAMGSVCASGGYYVACAADAIFAAPTTITASIGVIFESPDVHELLNNKLGVGLTVIKSGAYKDMGSPTRAMNDAERALFQSLIDQCYARFLDVVVSARRGHGPLPHDPAQARAGILPIADGRIMLGTQA